MTKQQRIDRIKCDAFDLCKFVNFEADTNYVNGVFDLALRTINNINDEPEEQSAFSNLKPMEFEIKLDKDQWAKATGIVSE